MKRIYDSLIQRYLQQYNQMLFLSGPRRVGKSTLSLGGKKLTKNFAYYNWDNYEHKKIIITGGEQIIETLNLQKLYPKEEAKPILVFDEIHKYSKWKSFLKDFFDTYGERIHIIVTSSSKLNICKKGGDSLLGRYFSYRVHPISVAECVDIELGTQEVRKPKTIKSGIFQALFEFGGFPETFIKKDRRFSNRWQCLCKEQLFRQDVRDLTRVQEISQLEMLAELVYQQSGQLVNYSNLANKINVSVDTIRRWFEILNSFYYCFTIRPWTKNISRSLLKEPKVYQWDWSNVKDVEARAENFVASHLLKAVHFWTDYGFGNYNLYFLRDKEKHEVDFIVTKDDKPWFMVDVKYSNDSSISKNLFLFQKQTNALHAFQVVFDMEPVDQDCFSYREPVIVPVQTLLSQLV